jgi:hypothetical protein
MEMGMTEVQREDLRHRLMAQVAPWQGTIEPIRVPRFKRRI